MLSLIEVEWPVIIEKHLGPLRVKFNTKQTPLNLSEVESKFIEKRHVSQHRHLNWINKFSEPKRRADQRV